MLTLPPMDGRERIIHIHENAYCTILSWGKKFTRFQIVPKQASINAFYVTAFLRCQPQRLHL